MTMCYTLTRLLNRNNVTAPEIIIVSNPGGKDSAGIIGKMLAGNFLQA